METLLKEINNLLEAKSARIDILDFEVEYLRKENAELKKENDELKNDIEKYKENEVNRI